MKSARLWMLCLAPPLFASGVDYRNFCSTAGLNLIGNAAQSGCALRIASAAPFTRGAAWYATPQPVAAGFDTQFDFGITSASPAPGDGFAFLIQNASPFAIGPAGGALGYYGIPNSLAIEFDIYRNVPPLTDYGDPNANHIAIQSCGTAPNTPSHVAGCTLGIQSQLPALLADGQIHTAHIVYQPGNIRVSLDNTPVLAVPLDLSRTLALSGGTAWTGFTGATGGAWANQDIHRWSFQNVPEPAGYWLAGVGLTLCGWLLRRVGRR